MGLDITSHVPYLLFTPHQVILNECKEMEILPDHRKVDVKIAMMTVNCVSWQSLDSNIIGGIMTI